MKMEELSKGLISREHFSSMRLAKNLDQKFEAVGWANIGPRSTKLELGGFPQGWLGGSIVGKTIPIIPKFEQV